MNVHAAALPKAHRFDDRTSAFASDVIDGLTQQPKRLSPKYFYDAAGSELFEQITLLPEYYPTRTELGILRDRGAEIRQKSGCCSTSASSAPMCRSISPAISSMPRPAR
jgi:uncharacterized SAM-dependent methyltransferase